MTVYVNDQEIHLLPGMTVRHALIQTDLIVEVETGKKRVYDQWGNEVGLSGALREGEGIFVR